MCENCIKLTQERDLEIKRARIAEQALSEMKEDLLKYKRFVNSHDFIPVEKGA